MSAPALEIIDLSYHYRSNWTYSRKVALLPFSLTVQEGEAFGFLGHNGAGKTTTIKCILNLVNPTGGRISLFGKDSRSPQSRTKVGYIPEQPYFYDNLKVAELLSVYGKLSGISGQQLRSRIEECAHKVGVADRLSARLRTLSKGLVQRVALAQSLLCSPRLLILDEPFSGLDPIGRREFRTIFHELTTNGTTLFVSSHVLPDVEFLCSRVSIMAHGELKGVFQTRDLPHQSDSRIELVVKGERGMVAPLASDAVRWEYHSEGMRCEYASRSHAEEALRAALASGLTIVSFQSTGGGLEELFMRVVQGAPHA